MPKINKYVDIDTHSTSDQWKANWTSLHTDTVQNTESGNQLRLKWL